MEGGASRGSAASNRLRACLGCALVKPAASFKSHGCPNCAALQLERPKNFNAATSAAFRGTIGLVDPKNSWVARWQRIDGFAPGTYAMTVEGGLSDDYVEKLEQCGRVYFDRNQSFELK
ncbi:transcription elongation factor SPT4 [Pancytospora philotis]|nr:transcription elongation factor SPT4 [Pancytospora philotis]